MSINQNLGGEKPSFSKALRMIIENTPFVYDSTGDPIICADVDDYFQTNHIKNRKSVKVQGDNASRVSVLQRARTEFPSLGIYPDYLQIFKWLLLTFQLHKKTTVGGADIYEFRKFRRGIPKTATATLEAGEDNSAIRALGGAVQELELSSGAETDPEMTVSLVAAEAQRGVTMTGATLRNAVLQVQGSNVTTPGVFAIKVGNNAPVNVSFAIGDTTAQTVTKLAAAGLTATVTGRVENGAGEKHTIAGSGNIIGPFYGDLYINTATEDIAAAQVKIRAKAGRVTATVTGVINKPTNNNLLLGATATAVPASGTAANANDGNTATVATLGNVADGSPSGFVLTMDRGAGAAQTEVNGLKIDNGFGGFDSGPDSYAETSADNVTWTPLTGNFQILHNTSYTYPTIPGVVAKRYVRLVTTHNQAAYGQWQIQDVALIPATITPGSATLQIAYDSAAGNVGDIESVIGGGYTGTTTQPGASGGAIQIAATAPTNTPVTISLVSGNGWSGAVAVPGSNGVVQPLPAFPFAASDWTLARADNLADLGNAAKMLNGVVKYAFKVENCVMPRNTANGTRTHSTVKKGTYDISLDFTMDDDTTATRGGQLDDIIRYSDEQTNNVSKPSWFQIYSEADSLHALTIQSWMHVATDLSESADEDVNVYDISLEENNYSPEDFSTRLLLKVPTGTFAF